MKYAIEMYFDKSTEAAVMRLAHKIADAGISTKYLEWKTRPHVTLGVFNDIDEEQCKRRLREFAGSRHSMPVFLESVGMFTDTKVLFLSPTMTRALYDLHSELYALMTDCDTKGWEWYCPDGWVPHCTVALTGEDGPDAFYQASGLLLRTFEKLQGAFTSVGLVKITFPVEELATFAWGE